MKDGTTRATRLVFAVALPAFAACSLAFAPDELSNGTAGNGGAGGTGGSATIHASASGTGGASQSSVSASVSTVQGATVSSSTGTVKKCGSDPDCDDLNPCTKDSCDPMVGCSNVVTPGIPCGQGTDCTPAPTCAPSGVCAPGIGDPAKCDDKNACTIDACGVSGCTHTANVGAACSTGDPCAAGGTCDGAANCVATPFGITSVCAEVSLACPPDRYKSAMSCDPACSTGCGFCLNHWSCSKACGAGFTACCAGDCATACPPGYHSTGPSAVVPASCTACGQAVDCAKDP